MFQVIAQAWIKRPFGLAKAITIISTDLEKASRLCWDNLQSFDRANASNNSTL